MTTHWLPKALTSRSIRPGSSSAGVLIEILSAPWASTLAGALHAANAAGHAEGDVDGLRHPPHPVHVDAAALGAGRDVVENQFVGALVAVTGGQFDDVAHDAVIAKAHALHDLAIAHVEAGHDAPGHAALSLDVCHDSASRASATVKQPSSKALPTMAEATPVVASWRRSSRPLTPPEACTSRSG